MLKKLTSSYCTCTSSSPHIKYFFIQPSHSINRDIKIQGWRMSMMMGRSLNACLSTSGSRFPYIPAVAVLSVTSKQLVCRFVQNVSWLQCFYKISFIILNILRIMESITFLIHLTTLLGPDFCEKTCFFPSPLNRSWLQPTRVPRILLSKFSYCLFFMFLTMNVMKLNMNYP